MPHWYNTAASELGARMYRDVFCYGVMTGKLVKNTGTGLIIRHGQALITRELSEICGGAEALKQQ